MTCSACARAVNTKHMHTAYVEGENRGIRLYLCPDRYPDVMGDKDKRVLSFEEPSEPLD